MSRLGLPLGIAAALAGLDQASKIWAGSALVLHDSVPVMPGFRLTLMHNTGAAFSLLAHAGGWQRWLFCGLAITVSLWLVHLLRTLAPGAHAWRWGLTLVLGGAVGNLVDRLRLGYVVDFIELYWRAWSWPAFNLADTSITLGAGFLLLAALRPEEQA